jgi:DNA-binding NarL/FixJ family response regulator
VQTVSVAISDTNYDRRSSYEYALREMPDVRLLANDESSADIPFTSRRLKSRINMTIVENELARIKRLMPRVLLMDMNLCAEERCEMLESLRRECPETLVVLVGDESGNEELIMNALIAGARGYLSHETVHHHLPKVAKVVHHGEFWVARKMLGTMMDRVKNHELH